MRSAHGRGQAGGGRLLPVRYLHHDGVHRNLLYGGIFLYPADRRDPTKPTGKLRLLCEANPLAFVITQAGGAATDGERDILSIVPDDLHQRVPLFIGSKNDVAKVMEIYGRTRPS